MRKIDTKPNWRPTFGVAACLAMVGASGGLAQSMEEMDDEVFELSPFEVSAGEEQGYRATSSLLGGRTSTGMKDIANSVDVITKDLMEDLAITDVQDMAAIANNVEPAEVGFANGNGEEREAWNFNYLTIRGFKVGTATRNFMNLETSVEAYNAQSVDFSKGPNAVLFGLGDPGGSYNYSTKVPFFTDENKVSYKIGSEGGQRATADINKVLIEDKLALRVNALSQDWEYFHKPGYTVSDALHASLRWKPTEKTTLTLSHEYNNVDRAYPRKVFSADQYSTFLDAGSPEVVDFYIAEDDPRNPNGISQGNAILLAGSDTAVDRRDYDLRIIGTAYIVSDRESATRSRWLLAERATENGLSVDNPQNLIDAGYPLNYQPAGTNTLSDTRFNVTEFNLQQKLTEDLYLDFSYGKAEQQKLSTHSVNTALRIEPEAGEHFGEYYTATSRPMQLRRYWDIEDYRLSLSYDFDFGERSDIFGTHRLAAMVEENEKNEVWDQWRMVTTGTPDGPITTSNFAASSLRPLFKEYFDPSAGEYYSSDWRDSYWDKETMNIDGYTFEWTKTDGWANKNQTYKLDTKLYVLQSRFWNDRIVTSIGYRDESREEWLAQAVTGDRSNPYTIVVPEFGYVEGTPAGDISFRNAALPEQSTGFNSGISRNHGVVFHATDWISFSYSKANSIGLPSESEDIYGELLGATDGVTDEYGVRFNLWEDRLNISLNAYETVAQQTRQFSAFIQDLKAIETILYSNPDVTGSTEDLLEGGGSHSRSDEVAEGVELIVNGRFGNGWTFRLSGRQNETIINEAGTDMLDYFAGRRSVYANPDYANLTTESGSTTLGSYLNTADYEAAKIVALQGNQNFPSSEYRMNGVVKYSFQGDSALKGASVGSSFSWASAPIIGYFEDADGNFDVSRAAKGEERTTVDFFATYGRPINDKVDWRVQFNVKNVFDDDDPYVIEKRSIGTDPSTFEWQDYKWRPTDGLTWSLTNSFIF
ncbi:hypothetical protein IEN85_03595 [Pelagicoccus sp. NFK12]|uniref:TonB-dependent receptor plug domain-containing protein n=1 Tax=Pelagicoccus enzymogenes TaxID=2773457 RepID=A0A927IFX9_9BACT|nr:TonB-dependent receptor plug domain-containing protein [Pelagicoccus enzymogenes]MBD5778561.1 hypothetical protein [Pelagicoccus enzymogenes]MDQ8197078.1 hypothetical protein [Pelagicoccus enzymogenes]